MKKLFISLSLMFVTLFADATVTWDLNGTDFKVDTLSHATIGPGMTTTSLRLKWLASNATTVYYTTIDLTNPDLELRGVQANDRVLSTENILSMGNRKNKEGNGQYIAGTNGDFFEGKTGKTSGHSIVDGKFKSPLHDDGFWPKWASYVMVGDKKDVNIAIGLEVGFDMTFPNNRSYYAHLNCSRADNYLVIYNSIHGESTQTNIWGRECTMKLVSGSLEDETATFEITSEGVGNCDGSQVGDMAIPKDGYVLSGVGTGMNLMMDLHVGQRVTVKRRMTLNKKTVELRQAIGGCSMLVIDGQIAPAEYLSANVVSHFSSNQARTAIGYNKDRTKLIMLVADKYAATETLEKSTGFAMTRLAPLMQKLGCYTAMAFDGGGSSTLYNKGFGIRNIPYGSTSYFRPVTNGFFAVSTTPVDNTIAAIEVLQKNVRLSSGGKLTPVVYGFNKYGVLVNKNVTGFTFNVAPELGTVSGTTFTAGSKAGSTHGVVTYGNAKAGVRILTNGGGKFVTSGDDDAPLMVKPPYVSEEPEPEPSDEMLLSEQWSFFSEEHNDNWDGSAPDWSSTDAIKSQSCTRFATGFNGDLYTVDMKTMSIARFDQNGALTPLYKLPALSGREIDGTSDYYGCAISSDDHGNFLIGHYFTKAMSNYVWTVYDPKSGKAKHFNLPSSTSSLRIDNVGRVVGDLTRNAYVFVSPQGTGNIETQKVNIIHFEGNGDVDQLSATNDYSVAIYMGSNGNTNGICQPFYGSVSAMSGIPLKDTFFNYSIAGNGNSKDVVLFNGSSQNYASGWGNFSGLNGFDTFTLGGKRYFVVAYASPEEYSNKNKCGHNILVMDEDGNQVAYWCNPDYTSNAGYNSIVARKLDENSVNIYVYNCTGKVNGKDTGAVAGALLLFSDKPFDGTIRDDVTSGIGFEPTVDTDADARPVYYNLQGVQIDRPSPGIYIVRRGNKVTKEFVR